LHKAGIVLDIRDGRLWRKSRPTEKYLLSTELYQAGRLDVPVYAAEKRIIPPYHETYLAATVPSSFDPDPWEATTTSIPSRISTANCLVVVKNNSTALQIANLTPRRQVIHKGQILAYLEPLAGQWITPSTGILRPQSQHHTIHSHNNNMYDDENNDQCSVTNAEDIHQHHNNNAIINYQSINKNSLINDNYSMKHPNPTTFHGPISLASDPTLELEPLMPVINKEGLTHVGTHIDTYIDSHNSMREVEEEGGQETEHEKEEKYTYVVVKENKESYNVSAPSSSQAPESEEFRAQLLRDLDLSSASLSDVEEKLLSDLVLKYADLFTSKPGRTNIIKHHIDVGDAKPIKQQPYRALPPRRNYITQERIQMQEQNIIEPATGPWAAPVTLQPKRDGTMRRSLGPF
ncbi:unnamed protein product, partial [Didymodactylos carnosus]